MKAHSLLKKKKNRNLLNLTQYTVLNILIVIIANKKAIPANWILFYLHEPRRVRRALRVPEPFKIVASLRTDAEIARDSRYSASYRMHTASGAILTWKHRIIAKLCKAVSRMILQLKDKFVFCIYRIWHHTHQLGRIHNAEISSHMHVVAIRSHISAYVCMYILFCLWSLRHHT